MLGNIVISTGTLNNEVLQEGREIGLNSECKKENEGLMAKKQGKGVSR